MNTISFEEVTDIERMKQIGKEMRRLALAIIIDEKAVQESAKKLGIKIMEEGPFTRCVGNALPPDLEKFTRLVKVKEYLLVVTFIRYINNVMQLNFVEYSKKEIPEDLATGLSALFFTEEEGNNVMIFTKTPPHVKIFAYGPKHENDSV